MKHGGIRRHFFRAGLVCALLFVAATALSCTREEEKTDKLNGFIEYVEDGTPTSCIKRMDLSSGSTEGVFCLKGVYVMSVDTSRRGERILSLTRGIDTRGGLFFLKADHTLSRVIEGNTHVLPSFAPDGRSFAYLCVFDHGPTYWAINWKLHVAGEHGKPVRKLSELPCYHSKPSWFPDQKRIAVASKDLRICIVDTGSGATQEVLAFGISPVVSHDGKKIAYFSKDIDESIKRQMAAVQNMTNDYYYNVYQKGKSPFEVRKLAGVSSQFSIYIYDMETKKSVKLTKDLYIENPVVWSPDDRYLLYNERLFGASPVYVLDTKTGKQTRINGLQARVMAWRNGK